MSLIALVEPALTVLGETPAELQLVDAGALLERHYPNISVDRAALIGPLTGPDQCQQAGRLLELAYPGMHKATLLQGVTTTRAGPGTRHN